MNEQKRNEILAFFWFVVSVLIFLALISYTPDDVSFEVSTPNSPARNLVGVAGAYGAWFLGLLFGRASFFFPPLFLVWAFAKWMGKKGQTLWLKSFSTSILFLSACAIFSSLSPQADSSRFLSGGLIGYFFSGFLAWAFGSAGLLVAFSLFVLSILLASELLLLQAAGTLFSKAGAAMQPSLDRAFAKAGTNRLKLEEKTKAPRTLAPQSTPAAERVPPKVKLPQNDVPAPIKFLITKPIEPKPNLTPARGGSLPVRQAGAAISGGKPTVPAEPVEEAPAGAYHLPPLDLLQSPPPIDQTKMKDNLELSSQVLEDTLRDFGIDAKVVEVEQGPTITRYELQPAAGVKVQKITTLENDIALAMRATSVRIIAPIPGKAAVGIEVPNSLTSTVYLKEVLQSNEFRNEASKIAIVIGKDTAGTPLVLNLSDMPHLLIAGATNTGKSVCINSIVSSILFKSTPEEVRFLMIDPKMVELHFYNDLPHLIAPVVTDKTKAPGALAWLCSEMDRRYKLLSRVGAKNIAAYNEKVVRGISPESILPPPDGVVEEAPILFKKIPYIVLIIDELADLMLTSANEVETAITRLAQLARAVGIHMILATQRPSVDVITGVIKANFPARIAFQVASKVDSRTILDENGADKLLGRGDLLLMDPRKSKLVRAQGAWVQDAEIEKVTKFIRGQRKASYQEVLKPDGDKKAGSFADFKRDEVYEEAKRIVLDTGQASVSMIQRRLGLGYTRAARLVDMMEEDGVVGPYRGAKPREILVARPNKAQPAEAEENPA